MAVYIGNACINEETGEEMLFFVLYDTGTLLEVHYYGENSQTWIGFNSKLFTGFEDAVNKVTTLDNGSTDAQYPSAKCVYDAIAVVNAKTFFITFTRTHNLDNDTYTNTCDKTVYQLKVAYNAGASIVAYIKNYNSQSGTSTLVSIDSLYMSISNNPSLSTGHHLFKNKENTVQIDYYQVIMGQIGQQGATVTDIITYSESAAAEIVSNKVTALSSSSTDTQYPSAKCVYDLVGDVESLLQALR